MVWIPENIAGRKYGTLTVLYKSNRKKHTSSLWMCRCDCGNEIYRLACELKDIKLINSCAECKPKQDKRLISSARGLTRSPPSATLHALVHLDQFYTNPVTPE